MDILGLALVYAIIGSSIGAALVLDRRGWSGDSRKLIHMGVGCFVLAWWMFSANWIMLVFFTVPVAVILFFAMVGDNPVSRSRLGRIANEEGHRYGLFLYAVTITILVALFWDHWTAATVGVVAMTWGDGLGSVIGRKFGKHRILNGKSLEGSLAVFAATALASSVMILLYAWLSAQGLFAGYSEPMIPFWAVSLMAGALAAVLEALCPGEYDNLVIPIVVAVAAALAGL